MRHLYECPLRWADIDVLGHVNNVTWVDYLQEARVDLMRTMLPTHPEGRDSLVEGIVVVRHEVAYVASMPYGPTPVRIETWVTQVRAASFTLAYEVFHDDPDAPDGRRVHLRASTVLSPFVFAAERPRRLTPAEREALGRYAEEPSERTEPAVPAALSAPGAASTLASLDRVGATRHAAHVRFSDVDLYRHVNNVVYFDYLQEARFRLIGELAAASGVPRPAFVVARAQVDYRAPMLLRPTPYDVWSRVTHVGRTSLVVESEIDDGTRVLARGRVVLVGWDPVAERPSEPPAELRAVLEASLPSRDRPARQNT